MNAHKTAIKRNGLSGPAKYLVQNGLIDCWDLDFGSGHGMDAHILYLDAYDPYYSPEFPTKKYDTIMCNYVLNVIESPEERQNVIDTIKGLLRPRGVAFLSVRNDKKNLNGRTKIGTWQGYIELDLPVETKTSNFVMYRLENK